MERTEYVWHVSLKAGEIDPGFGLNPWMGVVEIW